VNASTATHNHTTHNDTTSTRTGPIRTHLTPGRMTRDQRLIGWFAALALFAAGLVSVGITGSAPPTIPVLSRNVAVGPDGVLSLQFVGNTMVGGPLQGLIDQRGYDFPFAAVKADTQAADFVVASAEAPITEILQRTGPATRSLTSRPPAASALARAGVDALTLASEPVFDTGPRGLTDSITNAEKAGLATFGAGPDLNRAQQPLLLRTEVGTIGLIGMGDSPHDRARDLVPGMMVLSPGAIIRQRDIAKAGGADWVVAVVHWGPNYETVQPEQRYWAKLFADAGYDLVVGSGPRITQPIETLGEMPVIYSLGNFVYGTKGRFEELADRGFGLSVGLEFVPHQAPKVTVRCLLADNRRTGFQPSYCNPQQSASFLPVLGDLHVQGNRAVLTREFRVRREAS
jgi:poly-gamma-glutamate synthesis protein (capsule biosynthesis protein)